MHTYPVLVINILPSWLVGKNKPRGTPDGASERREVVRPLPGNLPFHIPKMSLKECLVGKLGATSAFSCRFAASPETLDSRFSLVV